MENVAHHHDHPDHVPPFGPVFVVLPVVPAPVSIALVVALAATFEHPSTMP